MPTFAELKRSADSPTLVRKPLEAVAFMAPLSVDLPEAITDTGGLPIALPEGYWPCGLVTPDGYTFGGDVEKQDVDALGYSTPVRSDITRAPKTVSFTLLESDRRPLAELIYGVDLSTITPGANGEIVFDEPALPAGQEYRLVIISKDGGGASEWLRGKGYPRVKLASNPEEAWSAEDPRQYPVELDVYTDTELGTPVRHYIGGTAVTPEVAADLGFGTAPIEGASVSEEDPYV